MSRVHLCWGFSALLLAATFVVGTAPAGRACVCVGGTGEGADEAAFATADVVFVGTAVHGTRVRGTDHVFDPWTVAVESVQKGPKHEQFLVNTESAQLNFVPRKGIVLSASSCGSSLQPGSRYQIFAKANRSGELDTGACTGSRLLSASTAEPYHPPTDRTPAMIVAGGALLALAIALRLSRSS